MELEYFDQTEFVEVSISLFFLKMWKKIFQDKKSYFDATVFLKKLNFANDRDMFATL